MNRFSAKCRWLVLTLAFTLILGGCGNGGDDGDIVYLYLFNATPTAETVDIIGPSGTLASGLEYGERTDDPVEFNRDLGDEITILADGASEIFTADIEVYSMYPHETATVVTTRRADQTTLNVSLMRHVQSISEGCRIAALNGLSLNSDNLGEYDFILGWDMTDNFALAGYDQDREDAALDGEDRRDDMYDQMEEQPYFAVMDEDDVIIEPSTGVTPVPFAWIGPRDRIDPPWVQFEDGTVTVPMKTEEYINCVDGGGETCNQPVEYDVITHPAGGEDDDVPFVHYWPETIGNPPGSCDANHRIFTDFGNVFDGAHGDGNWHTFDTSFEPSEHWLAVLYGRPVNPELETWVTDESAFEELPD